MTMIEKSPKVQPVRENIPTRYRGEVAFVYAFDIAYDMKRGPIASLMGNPVAEFQFDASKRNPRQLFFHKPLMVRMPALERIGPQGPVRVERSVKILPVGAMSLTFRVPFEVDSLMELIEYHDLRFNDGHYLYDEAIELAEQMREALLPYSVKPVPKLSDEEAYTVFFISSGLAGADGQTMRSEDWLAANRRQVAALLTEEPDPEKLSSQEAKDSTNRYISYYDRDLVVIDWDAALVVDEPKNYDETLYLMEVANVQLEELEAYDAILDEATERAYRDLARQHPLMGYSKSVQQSLREIRVDMARLSDELSNTTKFFGDWHLARMYKTISERFHLADWHHTIDEKLKTLDDMYQLLSADRNNRVMMILEVAIVALFVIDIVLLFWNPITTAVVH